MGPEREGPCQTPDEPDPRRPANLRVRGRSHRRARTWGPRVMRRSRTHGELIRFLDVAASDHDARAGGADRGVRAPGDPRRRRHGGRLPGARHPARPPRGPEDPPARAGARPRGRPAVLPGGPGRRPARPREHRPGLHASATTRTTTTSPSSTSRGRRSASGSSGTARCRSSEAINYTLQIAGALVHAAERGVVHRDIKPSNIIVTPQGRAKLVDMGLARRFERDGGDDGLTQSGMTLGTFDYISPEQARDPRDVDVRSDLYSLGCTLFHMLTGRPAVPRGDRAPEAAPAPGGAAARRPRAQPRRPARPGGDPGEADGQGPRPPLPDARAARPRPADRGRRARAAVGQPRGPGLDVGAGIPGRGNGTSSGASRPPPWSWSSPAWSGGAGSREPTGPASVPDRSRRSTAGPPVADALGPGRCRRRREPPESSRRPPPRADRRSRPATTCRPSWPTPRRARP